MFAIILTVLSVTSGCGGGSIISVGVSLPRMARLGPRVGGLVCVLADGFPPNMDGVCPSIDPCFQHAVFVREWMVLFVSPGLGCAQVASIMGSAPHGTTGITSLKKKSVSLSQLLPSSPPNKVTPCET